MRTSPSDETHEIAPGFPLKRWILPVTVLIFAVIAEFFGDAARLQLRFDRAAIEGAEWWRVLSGHFVHLGWRHLGLNAFGLLLVWLLVGRAFSPTRWALLLVLITAGTSAGLWWLSPQVGWYVGLSGLLHGLLVAGLVGQLRHSAVESVFLLVAVAAKLALEHWSGPLPGSEAAAGGSVVTEAHLYGAMVGACVALPGAIRDFRPASI